MNDVSSMCHLRSIYRTASFIFLRRAFLGKPCSPTYFLMLIASFLMPFHQKNMICDFTLIMLVTCYQCYCGCLLFLWNEHLLSLSLFTQQICATQSFCVGGLESMRGSFQFRPFAFFFVMTLNSFQFRPFVVVSSMTFATRMLMFQVGFEEIDLALTIGK